MTHVQTMNLTHRSKEELPAMERSGDPTQTTEGEKLT